MPEQEQERLLTVAEAGSLLHLERHAIYMLIKGGQLQALRVGYHYRFLPQDLRDYLERGKVQKEAP